MDIPLAGATALEHDLHNSGSTPPRSEVNRTGDAPLYDLGRMQVLVDEADLAFDTSDKTIDFDEATVDELAEPNILMARRLPRIR